MSSYSLSRVDYRCSVSFDSPCGSKVPEPRLCLAKGGAPESQTCAALAPALTFRKGLVGLEEKAAPPHTKHNSKLY